MQKNKSSSSFLKAKLNYIAIMLLGIIIGLIIGFALSSLLSKTSNSDSATEDDAAENNITTYLYDSNVLEGSDKESALDAINARLDTLKHQSSYIQVQVAEDDFDTYMYSTNGECFAQSSTGYYTAVTLSNGQTVKLDAENEEVIIDKDADIISLMQRVVEMCKENKDIKLYDMVVEDDTTKEYRIDMIGKDVFRELYAGFSDELAESMVSNVETQMGEDWEPHFIYCITMNDENLIMFCYTVDQGNEYTNWVSQGYLTMGDWNLDPNWYDNIQDKDYDTVLSYLESTVSDLEDVIKAYALENNIDMSDAESTVDRATDSLGGIATTESTTESTAESTTGDSEVANTEADADATVENETASTESTEASN